MQNVVQYIEQINKHQ